MLSRLSRREFVAGLGAVVAASFLPDQTLAHFEPLYPPVDLSYFENPISPAPAEIRFGYAAITWGGDDRQAIDRKSTRLNSSHGYISYAVFCLKKKKKYIYLNYA